VGSVCCFWGRRLCGVEGEDGGTRGVPYALWAGVASGHKPAVSVAACLGPVLMAGAPVLNVNV